jgi:hypothetical protein
MSKKPLATRTINPLPFQDLEPHRFEDLVRNLVYDFKNWRSIEATGKGGNDNGFDVRAWEEKGQIINVDENDDDFGVHPMEGNLWKLQCKREGQLGPTRIKAIINEGLDNDDIPYGYILAAPATFSKRSYDVFRDMLRSKGVLEFYLWGRPELEDMLFLPKNDSILFAFFGISLITRKRLRTSEIKFSIHNKNKLFRCLGDGDATRTIRKPFLARDFKDAHYPSTAEYKNFDKIPRWKEYTAVGFHPLGLVTHIAEHFAFVDKKAKTWDFVSAVDLLYRNSEDDDARNRDFDLRENIRNFWRFLPRANQAKFIATGVIFFDDMLVIDDKGDSKYQFPHIFVDFKAQSGPFRWFFYSLRVGENETFLSDEFKRTRVFPETFPAYEIGKVFKDRTVRLDDETSRRFGSQYFLKSLFDIENKYDFLNPRDIVQLEGVKSVVDDEVTFIEITSKYTMGVNDFLAEHAELDTHRQIERQTGRTLSEIDKLTILEFETISSWRLKNQ